MHSSAFKSQSLIFALCCFKYLSSHLYVTVLIQTSISLFLRCLGIKIAIKSSVSTVSTIPFFLRFYIFSTMSAPLHCFDIVLWQSSHLYGDRTDVHLRLFEICITLLLIVMCHYYFVVFIRVVWRFLWFIRWIYFVYIVINDCTLGRHEDLELGRRFIEEITVLF